MTVRARVIHETFRPGKKVDHPGMSLSQYLVVSLLVFTWLWGGLSSSRDEKFHLNSFHLDERRGRGGRDPRRD